MKIKIIACMLFSLGTVFAAGPDIDIHRSLLEEIAQVKQKVEQDVENGATTEKTKMNVRLTTEKAEKQLVFLKRQQALLKRQQLDLESALLPIRSYQDDYDKLPVKREGKGEPVGGVKSAAASIAMGEPHGMPFGEEQEPGAPPAGLKPRHEHFGGPGVAARAGEPEGEAEPAAQGVIIAKKPPPAAASKSADALREELRAIEEHINSDWRNIRQASSLIREDELDKAVAFYQSKETNVNALEGLLEALRRTVEAMRTKVSPERREALDLRAKLRLLRTHIYVNHWNETKAFRRHHSIGTALSEVNRGLGCNFFDINELKNLLSRMERYVKDLEPKLREFGNTVVLRQNLKASFESFDAKCRARQANPYYISLCSEFSKVSYDNIIWDEQTNVETLNKLLETLEKQMQEFKKLEELEKAAE